MRDAIKHFEPVCIFLYYFSAALIMNRAKTKTGTAPLVVLRAPVSERPLDRCLIYWTEGYIILKYEEDSVLPIILTWLPKLWFSEEQFAKFINFEAKVKNSPTPFVFDAHDFNDKKVLTESDLIYSKFPEYLKVIKKLYESYK